MTDTDRFAPLRRRFLSLGLGEIVAAAVFAIVPARLAFIAADRAEAALWSGLIPLLFILVQAGVYWLVARHHLPAPIPRPVARIYRFLRVSNPIVLLASLIGIVVAWPGVSLSAVLIIVIWLFAVAEYVNYFHVRLSYPWSTWAGQVGRWSTPRLVRDLRWA
ncbi:hypothetical protein D3I60_00410 [Brevibacterium permense]|uniref:hypothetical protein n=1 Tax=Brevibacterium permense TaxID=234834 RepID=UPI0021CF3C39|nr:hypothetical protein [Brevibacterium permense]MCU4295556.1 hypothetical protein [Brevibacterium permense]